MTIDSFSQHCPNAYFDSRDGELLVGGETVSSLAARVGRTPFYAYDRGVMTRKVRELRQVLPAEVELHYAIKANPMPEVVHQLAGLVDGLNRRRDAASARRLYQRAIGAYRDAGSADHLTISPEAVAPSWFRDALRPATR